MALHI